jgi:hypothetical protein
MAIQSTSCLSDQATSQSDHLIFLYIFYMFFRIFCFCFCIPAPFQPGAVNIKSGGM